MADFDCVCEKCGQELVVGEWPWCPHGIGNSSVVTDEIPGGLEIRHGLCHDDGSPQKFYSHGAIKREAKRRGLVNLETHVTDPRTGSDKSKITKPWF